MHAIRAFSPTVAHTSPHRTDKFTPSEEQPLTVQDRVELTAARAKEIEDGLGERVPGQVLVKVAPDLNSEQLKALAKEHGATIQQQIRIPEVMQEAFGGQLLVLEAGAGFSEAQTMAFLESDERVMAFGANNQMELFDQRPPQEPKEKLPNDVHADQWNIRNRNVPGGLDGADIQAGRAWTISTGKGKAEGGPIVAVVDSGIDVYHEDLKDNIWVNPREIKNGEDDDWGRIHR